jgi:SSS family solute:Na+ symporter
VAVTAFTKPKPVEELTGLVYGCTELPSEGDLPLWKRPVFWAGVSLVLFLVLQWIFW